MHGIMLYYKRHLVTGNYFTQIKKKTGPVTSRHDRLYYDTMTGSLGPLITLEILRLVAKVTCSLQAVWYYSLLEPRHFFEPLDVAVQLSCNNN